MPFQEPSDERESTGQGNGRDPRTGQFLPGNTVALRHGRRSTVVRRRIEEESRAELAERRQVIVADLGGFDQLSTIAIDVLERYLVAAALLGWMEDRLIVEGVVTAKGKRRSIHRAYLAQLDRVVRLASMLGLERRSRSVDPLEAVQRAVKDANR